jgi:hypothetical protein
MIEKRHDSGDALTVAQYSDCERYRYRWIRSWDESLPRIAFLMLNPSTATELATDPTVERCYRRAVGWGFGTLEVVNLFALRSTDPQGLYRVKDPVGTDNDQAITAAVLLAQQVVCGWGTYGRHLGRGDAVRELLERIGITPYCLKLTRNGEPGHPLYIGYDVLPTRMEAA